MSYKFSERVKQVLQDAGWYEGRCVDVSEAVQALEKIGIIAFPQAGRVLEELHGLQIKGGGNFTFYMSEIVTYLEEEDIPFLNKLIDEPLCPVVYSERVFLLISQSGKSIILHDEWTAYRLYPTFEDGLEAIFFVSSGGPEFVWIADKDKPRGYGEEVIIVR
jgi:hypothetical protein